ncbi:hypothetical protein [Symbiopectobacterium sp. RP]|uniref:hypothetical protein n=1 Tax=Symbiopectobacterium sp. RP TaxID=3248553 RepID=UPI003D2C1E55
MITYYSTKSRTPQDANKPQLASEPFALSPLSQISSGVDNPEASLTASARMTSLLGKINQLTGDGVMLISGVRGFGESGVSC